MTVVIVALLALVETSSFNVSDCLDNQWDCHGTCIHKRAACAETGGGGANVKCHPEFPLSCGDGQRCYAHTDSCWDRACLHHDCLKQSLEPEDIQRATERCCCIFYPELKFKHQLDCVFELCFFHMQAVYE